MLEPEPRASQWWVSALPLIGTLPQRGFVILIFYFKPEILVGSKNKR